MERIKNYFWNAHEQRMRALWRFFMFLLAAGLLNWPMQTITKLAMEPGVLRTSVSFFFLAICMLGALYLVARYVDKRPFPEFGFQMTGRWWQEFAFGAIISIAAVTLIFYTEWANGWIEIRGTFYTKYTAIPFFLAFLSQIFRYLCGGMFEELFSRGYMLRTIAEGMHSRRISSKAAIITAWLITSVIFGFLHIFNPNASLIAALNLSLIGLLYGLPFVLSGRLGMSIGLHMFWNISQNNLFGFPNSGKASNTSLLLVEQGGPEIWTGGAFGPEAGLVTTIAVLIQAAIVIWWFKYQEKEATLETSLAMPPTLFQHNQDLEPGSKTI